MSTASGSATAQRICLGSWVVQEDPDSRLLSHPRRYFCWFCCRPGKDQPSSPGVAFIRPSDIERGERATASLAYGWEFGIVAISEVLAEPAPCKTLVRSTRIRGVVTGAEGACGELSCPGCNRMGREELVLGLWPLTGNRVRRAPFGRHLL